MVEMVAPYVIKVPAASSLAQIAEDATSALGLDRVNPRFRTERARIPRDRDTETVQIALYFPDEPWMTSGEVWEQIERRGGTSVDIPQLLALCVAQPELIKAHGLLVALGSYVQGGGGERFAANIWHDELTDVTGLGALLETQEWRRGTCFPYVVPGN